MRRWKAAVAATAVAALTLAVAPAARADKAISPPPKPEGRWMTCGGGRPVSSGRITAARILARPGEVPYLQMKIVIDPCVRVRHDHLFAAALFSSQRKHRPMYVSRYYASMDAGHTMLLSFAVGDISSPADPEAYLQVACLSSRETDRLRTTKRLDCVRVSWPEADRAKKRPPTLVGHIRPDDPLVRRTAVYTMETDPGCADCNW
jgi:hypothetical protein